MVSAQLPLECGVSLKTMPPLYAPPPLVAPYRLPFLSKVTLLHSPPPSVPLPKACSTLYLGAAHVACAKSRLAVMAARSLPKLGARRFRFTGHAPFWAGELHGNDRTITLPPSPRKG